MSAKQFALKHREVEIEYNIGVTPGLPVLNYRDASGQRSYTAAEVAVEQTAQTAEFRTTGVYEDFSGVGTVPPQPASWHSIELHGTAHDVFQPQ